MTLALHQEPFRAGDKPYPHQNASAKYLWILMLLIVIGLFLRLTLIDGKSLWQDELYTLASATGNNLFEATVGEASSGEASGESGYGKGMAAPLPPNLQDPATPQPPSFFTQPISQMQPLESFWQALSRNIQMPAYPLLARGLISLFGPDPMMLRVVSALFGVLLIPASFWLGQLLLYNTPERRAQFGLVLASLVTVCGFQVTYSQTARVYALVTLTAVVATCFLLSLLRHYPATPSTNTLKTKPFQDAWPYWLGFTLFSALGLYTTYLYTFLLGFHIATVFLWAKPHKGFYLPMACCGAILAGLYLPWLPMYQAQQVFLKTIGHGNLTGLWNPISLIERLWNVLAEQITPKDLPGKLWSTVLITLGLIQGWRLKEARPIVGLSLLWLGAIIGGLLWIDLSHQTHRILSKRYTMLASPSLYLLMATGLYFLPPRWWGLPPQVSGSIWQPLQPLQRWIFPTLFGLTLGMLTLNSLAVVSGEKFVSKENYLGAARWINQRHQANDMVLVNHSGVHTAAMSFYLDANLWVGGISRKTREAPWQPDALNQTLTRLTEGHPRIWLVLTHSYGPVKTSIQDWLTAHHYKITSPERFSGVDVSLWVQDEARLSQ
jgi:uncharacterized membrane protein